MERLIITIRQTESIFHKQSLVWLVFDKVNFITNYPADLPTFDFHTLMLTVRFNDFFEIDWSGVSDPYENVLMMPNILGLFQNQDPLHTKLPFNNIHKPLLRNIIMHPRYSVNIWISYETTHYVENFRVLQFYSNKFDLLSHIIKYRSSIISAIS